MNGDDAGKEIIGLLYNSGMIKTFPKNSNEGWKLHNGIWSPYYIQLRAVCSKRNSKEILDKIGDAMGKMIRTNFSDSNRFVGVATAGIPISVIASYKSGIPLCYTRKIPNVRSLKDLDKVLQDMSDQPNNGIHEYGEHSLIEGDLTDGDNITIIDDLITDGGSKIIAKRLIEFEAKNRGISVNCDNVAVIVDREQGGLEELSQNGLKLQSLIPFKSKGLFWLKEYISKHEFDIIMDYVENEEKYQNPVYREEILKKYRVGSE